MSSPNEKGIKMTIGKMLLLIVVALAAVAFAAPASATANPLTWKDNGVVLKPKEHATLAFTGKLVEEYLGPANTFSCNASITLTAEGGHTGTLTKFELETKSCAGIGKFANCILKDDKITTLPAVVHTTTTDFEITGITIEYIFEKDTGCANPGLTTIFKNITATPNKLQPIASVFLSGADVSTSHVLSGTLNAANPNTLGLG